MRWVVGLSLVVSVGVGTGPYDVEAGTGSRAGGDALPAGFPPLRIPADNPITAAKVELGRALFFDRRLSMDGTFACSSCHSPAHAFTDGRSRAIGVTGEMHPRSAMSLTNVAYNATLNWADPETTTLEAQMTVPMFSITPVEMGITGNEQEVLDRIRAEARYSPLFQRAFPDDDDPIGFDNIILAIASFERTLLSGNSPYDRYVYWDERQALTDSARRGMDLFFSDRLGCSRCHQGFNFSGPVVWADGPEVEPVFHNTALYDTDAAGSYPEDNRGLFAHTGNRDDMGRFRAPTLRNIALTAPYMHDGSIATLAEVIDHYATGGRASTNPFKSELLVGFDLAAEEKTDLLSFLDSLTDTGFQADPRFSDPFATGNSAAAEDPR